VLINLIINLMIMLTLIKSAHQNGRL